MAQAVANRFPTARRGAAANRAGQQADALVMRFEKQDFSAGPGESSGRGAGSGIGRVANAGVNRPRWRPRVLDSLAAAITGNSAAAQAAMATSLRLLGTPIDLSARDLRRVCFEKPPAPRIDRNRREHGPRSIVACLLATYAAAGGSVRSCRGKAGPSNPASREPGAIRKLPRRESADELKTGVRSPLEEYLANGRSQQVPPPHCRRIARKAGAWHREG